MLLDTKHRTGKYITKRSTDVAPASFTGELKHGHHDEKGNRDEIVKLAVFALTAGWVMIIAMLVTKLVVPVGDGSLGTFLVAELAYIALIGSHSLPLRCMVVRPGCHRGGKYIRAFAVSRSWAALADC